jgi:4-alpha-glucanotransferase
MLYTASAGMSGDVNQKCAWDSCHLTAVHAPQDLVALSPKYMGRPAAEETINDPNNPRHYWRYRIHYTLEDVLEDEPLISDLQALLLGMCCF